MKYPILAGVLTLLVGGGLAIADETGGSTQSYQPQDSSMGKQTQGAQKQGSKAESNAPKLGSQKVEDQSLFFDTSSAQVNTASAQDKLHLIAKYAKCHHQAAIILQGFADKRGTAAYNADLSTRRAVAVRDELIGMGVKPSQIVIESFGKTKAKGPLAHDRRVTASVESTGLGGENLSG